MNYFSSPASYMSCETLRELFHFAKLRWFLSLPNVVFIFTYFTKVFFGLNEIIYTKILFVV